jgi:hypothetical protein
LTVNIVPAGDGTSLKFQLSKKDLYNIVRVNASTRPFRKIAAPALAGFVFLGHSIDGQYLRGLVWAVAVVALYWGVSQLMFLLHVYGAANETFLVPQEIALHPDRMVVSSEHSTEEFPRPKPSDVKAAEKHLLIATDRTNLVFVKRSFGRPEDYGVLTAWLRGGSQDQTR